MSDPLPAPAAHDHVFGTDQPAEAERRTRWVVVVTAVMMVVEIVAGTLFGSMALLADGWHMGTHAAALGVAAFAYRFARKHARDPRFTFGTGKVFALGGFASAVGLGVVALVVIGESASRLAVPVEIRFEEALVVAVVGLVVNLGSAAILHDDHDHDEHHHDHNLRGAYLHVLADALTSVLAIAALTAGRLLGWTWTDPVTGLLGGAVIARWSWGLLRDTAAVLLDGEVGAARVAAVRAALEGGDCRVDDLHLWRVGPRHLAADVVVTTSIPRTPGEFRARLASFPDLAHVTVEVRGPPDGHGGV